MKKLYILLFTLLITSLSFGQSSDLYFSMYAEGSSNNKFVEIYNGTGGNIDLSDYSVELYSNGSGTFTNQELLTGTLNDGDVYVIYNSGADAGVTANGDLASTVTFYNGDDAVALLKMGSVIDVIGEIGVDPGSSWEVSGVTGATGEHTLTRKTSVCGPNSDWASSAGTDPSDSEWVVTAQDSEWGNIGSYVGCATIPTITITSPGDGAVLPSGTTSVNIEFITQDAPGGSTVDITVTKNAGSPTTTNNVLSSPFEITSTADSDTYEVTAELIDGGVIDFETINFSIEDTPPPLPTLPIFEDFNYSDGSLVPNGGWANTSGSAGDFMVSSGQAVVQHGTPSEDVSIEFVGVSGDIYYALNFSVDDLGAPYDPASNESGDGPNDFEYFAHFKDSGFNFSARLDVVPPTASGDFSVGIASDESTADAVWGTDLTYGVTYRAIVRYNQDDNIAQLWINPSAEGDTSILGEDRADPGDTVTQFQLRQSDSGENETVRVDNVNIGTTFGAVLSTQYNQIEGFSFSPNPTSLGYVDIKSRNSASMDVSVFDLLGKQVLKETISNNRLNVSRLNAGVYIMKVSQDDATTTKKLVIK